MDELDRIIITGLQTGFPVCDEPFREAGARFGIRGGHLLRRIRRLLSNGTLSRFGPLYQVERMGGEFVLAAMKIPPDCFDRIAEIVGRRPEVAHSYQREHEFNLWFVVAAESPESVARVLDELRKDTGLPILDFPKEREYFVSMMLAA